MELSHLVAFNLTLLAAMASPGPALLLALRMSMVGGYGAGVATGAGLGLMAATWTAAALLGLQAAFTLFPWAYAALKTAGALYLMWLAWGMWRDARKPLGSTTVPNSKAFRAGVLVNLGNPKSVLFASAVLIVIFPAGLSFGEKTLIVANHLIVEVIVYSIFAALLASRPARDGYLRAKPWLDRLCAAILGALGLRLLVGR